MARRRTAESDRGVNLDSLMDALTNVAAVLILVLILVQADVTRKVVEFMDNLKPATPEEVEESRADLSKLQLHFEEQQALLHKDSPTPEELEKETRKLALLEKSVRDNRKLLADLEELRKLEAALRKSRDSEQQETSRLQERIAQLEALLDSTPILKIPPPTVVTIPNSRPIPKNAEVYYAIAFNNRIHFIDPVTPLDLFMKEFQRHKRSWIHQRIKRQGADRFIYDPVKIVAHFENFDFGNARGQKITVKHNPFSTRLHIEIAPDHQQGGTTTEDLGQHELKSLFGKAMSNLSHKRGAVTMFWVHPNSFNTYLAARRAADKAGIPAGWEVRGNSLYRLQIPEVEVRRLKEPPPADPNAPKPVRPPPLKPSLD